MKLVSFSVTNYRSITDANKLALQNLTVLVGKNNEGKSNLLTALNVAMMAVITHGYRDSGMNGIPTHRPYYNWENDFPLQYRERTRGLESIFRLDFQLENGEVAEFHTATGIRGNDAIAIKVKIGRDNIPKIEVPKKGTSSYNQKSAEVTRFVSKKIIFNYIQAIRTEGMALNALTRVIADQMRTLQDDEEYRSALAKVKELQQRVLDDIAARLLDPLKTFLPNLADVAIKQKDLDDFLPRNVVRDIDVIINDGLATSISNKGDGIKSLVTLAILKDRQRFNGASVIAIEEPESHLHSGAIHSLVDVVHKMAENNQVIITTHNPLFVQQNCISSNIIVDSGKARPAKSIAEIREILGVMPSDNLRNARYLILVEGENDAIALGKILPAYSETIKHALATNLAVIKSMQGAGNLLHELQEAKQCMCKYVVLLDNDKAGLTAADKATGRGLLKPSEIKHTVCMGSKESEFEDCLKAAVYAETIKEKYNVDVACTAFRGNEKWSVRMDRTFMSQGTVWSEVVEGMVKFDVASAIPANLSRADLDNILIPQKSGFIASLASAIETMLKN